MKSLRVGLAGLGTVGSGVLDVLAAHGELLSSRAGTAIELKAVSRDVSGYTWFDDPSKLASDDGIDVFVELIGGEGDPAKSAIEKALHSGKHVVTANKAILAHHGAHLARLAEEINVALNFEAAVAGGISEFSTAPAISS